MENVIKAGLTALGYDGLRCEECWCFIEDSIPCGVKNFSLNQCEPGYKFPCDNTCAHEDDDPCEFHIKLERPVARR